jgi:ribosomal protein S18 acetylase RimI-like enzyme
VIETMIDPVIRLLAPDDLAAALALSSTAGWNQRLDDWRMMLRLAPAGSFAALVDGRVVGTAIGIDYGGFAWIAMMLVDPAQRGRGIGRRLLEAAMSAVPSDRPIRLDATPLGRPLYQRYGFEDEATLTRYLVPASDSPPSEAARADRSVRPEGEPGRSFSRVRQLTAADLQALAELDTEVFGGHRDRVLEWALQSAPALGQIVESEEGLAHYSCGRRGRLFDQIGPVVAGDDVTAQALVSASLTGAVGRPVLVDAFDSHRTFTAWLRTCGFQVQRPLFRMCRSSGEVTSAPGVPNRPALVEFAILGPEFG